MIHLLGTYQLQFPRGASIRAKQTIPPKDDFGEGVTHWEIEVGKFTFRIHLTPRGVPSDLSEFILSCTKKYVQLDQIDINGIPGVMFADCTSPSTWTEWWLKQGELMICINLQGPAHPTPEDIKLHSQIIQSLRSVSMIPARPVP